MDAAQHELPYSYANAVWSIISSFFQLSNVNPFIIFLNACVYGVCGAVWLAVVELSQSLVITWCFSESVSKQGVRWWCANVEQQDNSVKSNLEDLVIFFVFVFCLLFLKLYLFTPAESLYFYAFDYAAPECKTTYTSALRPLC